MQTAPACRGDFTQAPAPRLTSLAHGGGCGCKLSPAILRVLLSDQAGANPFQQLLVGTETGDDAAVWQIDEKTCVIATTDFFMPMVDDPFHFGRIAATNAISDVYAMGGRPVMALAILGMPLDKLPPHVVREILKGGRDVCAAAGIPVAGGHSIDSPEPIYGLAVIGICRPDDVRRNSTAEPGDVLILTKGLGVGIYSAAIKREALPPGGYEEMLASTTLLNRIGAELSKDANVHSITDVTGFGLLGHALEMARGSACTLVIRGRHVPLFSQAAALTQQGFVTGASRRNWASYGDAVRLPEDMPEWRRHLLTDPQTSGGLLVACAPANAAALTEKIVGAGYPSACMIGHVERGQPAVIVED
ncbi:selenide, water dikinase SelD [Mesorhizobium sp. BAC0120]|uniref:selenide, water dikinase SelD n=1 Tax=Mesorhizobium sp. BAC0120 TaxID=3090670 RepID=UPI00298CB548|nr:selenide, water dikinase SelD [Mesorhizobium sp. BAC0120]MDW6024223.1 selenide, water dikinase SelD [Mesorhizobium sp. BAC0120]